MRSAKIPINAFCCRWDTKDDAKDDAKNAKDAKDNAMDDAKDAVKDAASLTHRMNQIGDDEDFANDLEGEVTEDAVAKFVAGNALPLVVDFNQDTAQKIFSGEIKSLLLMFVSTAAEDYAAKSHGFDPGGLGKVDNFHWGEYYEKMTSW